MSIILDTPEQIHGYRLHVLLIGLETEIKFSGHQLTRGRSCYSRIKSEFNLKGNKQKVYDQFKNLMIEMGVPFKKMQDEEKFAIQQRDNFVNMMKIKR